MIIYTCPECGHDLLSKVLTCMPPIYKKYCPNCGWSHSKQEEVMRVPFSDNSFKMRDATFEEQKNIQEHIDQISEPTGVNFWDDIDTEASPCDCCSNNPKNGGNGICNCILGQQVIY